MVRKADFNGNTPLPGKIQVPPPRPMTEGSEMVALAAGGIIDNIPNPNAKRQMTATSLAGEVSKKLPKEGTHKAAMAYTQTFDRSVNAQAPRWE